MLSHTSPKFKARPFAQNFSAGFSLLEVLVAIAILSFIMMATYQVTSQTIQAKKRLGKMSEAYHAARSSMDRMVQDLSMAFLLEGKPHLGQKQGGDQLKTLFKGDDSGLAFTALSHMRLFQNARESEESEVGYKLERDEENRDAYVLMRREQAPLDKNPEEGGLWLPFASGVKKWKLEFYSDKQNDWQSSWNTASEPEPRLPRAVRITMTFLHPLQEDKELTFTTIAMVGLHATPINF